MSSNAGQILTLQEVAQRLRCSVSTVKLHIATGRLSAINLGTASQRHYRITEKAYADFLELESQSQAEPAMPKHKDPGIVSKRFMRLG